MALAPHANGSPQGARLRLLSAGAAVAVLALFAGATTPARADHIDERLLAESPRILQYLKDHNYHTVGVLKFSVKKGGEAANFNAGTLNEKMALRLEHALILLDDPDKPIVILDDVSKTASSQSRSASYKSTSGRRGLLDHSYPVAWGDEKKKPDALLTGEVQISKDMKKLNIIVRCFDAKNPDKMDEVVRMDDVKTDRNILASIGQSYVVPRKVLARGSRDADDAASDDASTRDKDNANPLTDTEDPVKLEIFYDDQAVTLDPDTTSPGEVKVGKHSKAADPKEGQKVKFKITNNSKETVGVVLAINGQSTLFKEDLTTKSPGECTKWIIAPGEVYSIEGFYMGEDGKDVHAFKVLSDDESNKAELAPEHKGVFSMFVFRTGSTDALNIAGADAVDLGARGVNKKAKDLKTRKADLLPATHTKLDKDKLVVDTKSRSARTRHAVQHDKRGLVVDDDKGSDGSTLTRVEFKYDPQPATSVFIRYWNTPTSDTGSNN